MRRSRSHFWRVDLGVAALGILTCGVIASAWLPGFVHRAAHIEQLLDQPRDIVMEVVLVDPAPKLRRESWNFYDANGSSRIRYSVIGAGGNAVVTEPPSGRVDVPALFDLARSGGLLAAPVGQGASHVLLATHTGSQWQRHTITFRAQELLGTPSRDYRLELDPHANGADLLSLESTPIPALALRKYVLAVQNFGTPAFRAACQAAREQVR